MLHRLSLLNELRTGGYDASLITTFNAYLPFYEEVVLRRMTNAGIRHNVLMMDAQQYTASILSHPPRLAGRRYTLIPVAVAGAGVFHPKLILLVGKKKALLAIGSHNVTLAGFGFNREVTNVIRIDGVDNRADLAIASQMWEVVEDWIEIMSGQLPNHVVEMIWRVREFGPPVDGLTNELPDNVRILAGSPGRKSLWSQLRESVQGRVTNIAISGAFFDAKLGFLRRVLNDLQPAQMVIGIDPKTVQIQQTKDIFQSMKFVRADQLGSDSENGGKDSGYLHAKGIFIQTDQGEQIFASGSANPSAPAWLATSESGNIELMLLRSGQDAVLAAKQTGYSSIFDMAPLESSDWITINANQSAEEAKSSSSVVTDIGVVEEDCILFNKTLIDLDLKPTFLLLDANRQEICRPTDLRIVDKNCVLTVPLNNLTSAVGLQGWVNGETKFELLLHHMRIVDEQARTGVQRRFRDALLSLQTDTPDISLLIECIDKIVFSDSPTMERSAPKLATREAAPTVNLAEVGTLAINISEVKKRKVKQRLKHSNDFSYLLDTLIYHLGVLEDRPVEELDRYGRNEEEQIGAEDDEGLDQTRKNREQQDDLLLLCHSKVRTVVTRMTTQLRAYEDGKLSLEQVLIRLLGVLAVLRELRACDGRVAWVEKGNTTVPRSQRLRLLDEVMLTLFEGKNSLLHLEDLDDLKHSDDVARLKGLIVWLAWDCGLTVDLGEPFMETREQLEARLRRNAMMLALAQTVGSDDVVIDEAQQSIGSLTTSELNWLSDLERLAMRCTTIKRCGPELRPDEFAQPGDIAIHKGIQNWNLRVVANRDSQNVSLMQLGRDKGRVTYRLGYLYVARMKSGLDAS